MTVVGIQLTGDEFLVVFLDVMGSGNLQQVVAGVHLLTERIQRAHHLRHISDDRVGILIWHLCKEVVGDGLVKTEFHLLWVDEYDLQLGGMLLI